jgi:aspartate/methionine/tyrosine aminotransferase
MNLPDTSTFCHELVQEAGLMLVPSALFHYGNEHVRFGFGRHDLPQALEALGQYLDSGGAVRQG